MCVSKSDKTGTQKRGPRQPRDELAVTLRLCIGMRLARIATQDGAKRFGAIWSSHDYEHGARHEAARGSVPTTHSPRPDTCEQFEKRSQTRRDPAKTPRDANKSRWTEPRAPAGKAASLRKPAPWLLPEGLGRGPSAVGPSALHCPPTRCRPSPKHPVGAKRCRFKCRLAKTPPTDVYTRRRRTKIARLYC